MHSDEQVFYHYSYSTIFLERACPTTITRTIKNSRRCEAISYFSTIYLFLDNDVKNIKYMKFIII